MPIRRTPFIQCISDVPSVTVLDPANRMNMPLWEGPARNAHMWLTPGTYPATTEIDSFDTTLDILVIVHATGSYAADTLGTALSGRINAEPTKVIEPAFDGI